MTRAGSADNGADEEADDLRLSRGSATYRRAVIAAFCAAIATFTQMYSPQGILPEIAADLGVTPELSSWSVGVTTSGVALAVLPWARVSDRIGRVSAMRIAIVASSVLGLATPLVSDIGALLVMRFLTGIALAGLPGIAIPALTETVRPKDLGSAVGAFIAGNALGGLIGRLTAGLFTDTFGWVGGMLAVAVLSAIASLVFLVVVPRTRVSPGPGLPVIRAALQNLRNRRVAVLLLQGFLLMGGFTVVFNFIAFHLEHPPFGLSVAQTSWLFLSYLAAMVASPVAWRIAGRVQPTTVLLASTGITIASLLLMLVPSLPVTVVAVFIFTGAFFGAHGIANGLVGLRAAGTPAASQAPALYTLSFYIGTSVFSVLGGMVFTAAGWSGSIALSTLTMLGVAALALWDARRRT